MSTVHHTNHSEKASRLADFAVGFEYNRTLGEERKLTKRRTSDTH